MHELLFFVPLSLQIDYLWVFSHQLYCNLVNFEIYPSLCFGWWIRYFASSNYTKCLGDHCDTAMSCVCFDAVLQMRYFLPADRFISDWSSQMLPLPARRHLPEVLEVIHTQFSVKYGGALLHRAYESSPSSYFLISSMPPTALFHHMVISCSLLKRGVWILICQPPRSQWRTKSNLLFSCCCPERRPHLDPGSL